MSTQLLFWVLSLSGIPQKLDSSIPNSKVHLCMKGLKEGGYLKKKGATKEERKKGKEKENTLYPDMID